MIGLTTFHGLLGQGENVTPTAVYGRLYNWYAASDVDFAPTDWKVPTSAELTTLDNAVSGGNALKESGTEHWLTDNGVDTYGFKGFGTGQRGANIGAVFQNIKENFQISSITENGTTKIYFLFMRDSDNALYVGNQYLKTAGLSVRLLYNGTGTSPATITDYEGRVYDVVQIGTQYWTVQNWACKYLNDGTEIPIVTDNTEWAALTTLACCAYDNDESKV